MRYRVGRLFCCLCLLGAMGAVYAAEAPVDRWLQDKTVVFTHTGPTAKWKFAHPAPPVSLLPPVWQQSFDWLQMVTGNGIHIKMYGGGALYGMKGGFKAIRAGVADYGTCYTVAESRGFELLKTFQAPYVAPTNPYLTTRIINELMASKLKKEFTARGVYPGHIITTSPLTLMSKKPIRTPEDLRGKKVISFMNIPAAAKALGFSEVHIPFPEIYTALQQGVVDAVIWVDMGFIPFKIYEQAKYYTALNIAPATLETCINRNSFNRLSTPMKQQVYDFQQKVGIAAVMKTEQFAEKSKAILRANGVEIINLTPTQQAQWKASFLPVVDQWMSDCDAAGKDCRGLVKDIKRLTNKYAGLSDDELMSLAIDHPVQGAIDF